MSVNRRKWCDPKTGKQKIFFEIYIDRRKLDGVEKPVRKKAKIQTRRGAEQEEREIREAIVCGDYDRKEEKTIPTLREFQKEFLVDYALAANNKPSELMSKRGIINRYLLLPLGDVRIDMIKIRNINGLKGTMLKKGLSPKTVNNALAVLGKMLRYAADIELIEKLPPIKKLHVPKPEFDFLSFEEADQLLEAAKYNPEWYAMIFFALRTGVRYGELCELRWSDVDLKGRRVFIRRGYYRGEVTTPKGGQTRELPLSPETAQFLQNHRHLKGELVFCKPDGGRHIHRRADVAIKRICQYAGLRRIGWHMLRHSYASHLVMRGVSLKTVQELLGHSTIEMTMRYAHLSSTVKHDAVAVLDSSNDQFCRTIAEHEEKLEAKN